MLTIAGMAWAFSAISAMAAGAAGASDPVQPAPIIDNDRVTVWNYLLNRGKTTPPTPHDLDCVIMYLEGGRIRTVDADGHQSVSNRSFGESIFVLKGSDAADTVVSGGPVFEVRIALKDHPAGSAGSLPDASSGLPNAFPRPGAVLSLDTARAMVWRYDWQIGVPTQMHVHDKDFVVVFRYSAEQKIVRPDGQTQTNAVRAGETRFRERGLTHSEEYPTDPQSAMFLELK